MFISSSHSTQAEPTTSSCGDPLLSGIKHLLSRMGRQLRKGVIWIGNKLPCCSHRASRPASAHDLGRYSRAGTKHTSGDYHRFEYPSIPAKTTPDPKKTPLPHTDATQLPPVSPTGHLTTPLPQNSVEKESAKARHIPENPDDSAIAETKEPSQTALQPDKAGTNHLVKTAGTERDTLMQPANCNPHTQLYGRQGATALEGSHDGELRIVPDAFSPDPVDAGPECTSESGRIRARNSTGPKGHDTTHSRKRTSKPCAAHQRQRRNHQAAHPASPGKGHRPGKTG